MRTLFVVLFMFCSLMGCSSDTTKIEAEVKSLKAEIAELKDEFRLVKQSVEIRDTVEAFTNPSFLLSRKLEKIQFGGILVIAPSAYKATYVEGEPYQIGTIQLTGNSGGRFRTERAAWSGEVLLVSRTNGDVKVSIQSGDKTEEVLVPRVAVKRFTPKDGVSYSIAGK